MKDKMIFGVCSRIANYFGWNVTVLRVIWAVFTVFYGAGVWLYLIAALVFYLLDKR